MCFSKVSKVTSDHMTIKSGITKFGDSFSSVQFILMGKKFDINYKKHTRDY